MKNNIYWKAAVLGDYIRIGFHGFIAMIYFAISDMSNNGWRWHNKGVKHLLKTGRNVASLIQLEKDDFDDDQLEMLEEKLEIIYEAIADSTITI